MKDFNLEYKVIEVYDGTSASDLELKLQVLADSGFNYSWQIGNMVVLERMTEVEE